MKKKCGHCQETKDVSNFYRRGVVRTDWMSYCKVCALSDNKARNKELKLAAFEHYGGCKCVCCGIIEDVFLSLDHPNNDGAKQRKEIGNGRTFYGWLKKMNYPELGLRVLCHNCNIGRQINGICPHQILSGRSSVNGSSPLLESGAETPWVFESPRPDQVLVGSSN